MAISLRDTLTSTRRPSTMQGNVYIKLGPMGGSGLDAWDDGVDHCSVDQIFISYSNREINSIQVAYRTKTNEIILAPKHGGDGPYFRSIKFKEPLKWVEGHSNSYCLSALKFGTESSTYGPFGWGGIPSFRYDIDSSISSFHGNACKRFLRSLGVYVDSEASRPMVSSSSRARALTY